MSKLAWGIVLLIVGILGFTDAIDLYDVGHLWRYWPVILIVLGVVSEAEALRERRSSGGYMLIAVGVWFLAGAHHFLGLNHRSALPLGIAVAGLGLIVHAIVDAPVVKKEKLQ
jgi:uncharacterized membrane protein HdeD (DUF308 family)